MAQSLKTNPWHFEKESLNIDSNKTSDVVEPLAYHHHVTILNRVLLMDMHCMEYFRLFFRVYLIYFHRPKWLWAELVIGRNHTGKYISCFAGMLPVPHMPIWNKMAALCH